MATAEKLAPNPQKLMLSAGANLSEALRLSGIGRDRPGLMPYDVDAVYSKMLLVRDDIATALRELKIRRDDEVALREFEQLEILLSLPPAFVVV
jgi:hypothetical protein